MSSWRGPTGSTVGQDAGVREDLSADRLPAIHFHGSIVATVRRNLLFDANIHGGRVGLLRGFRSAAPEDHVLFDDVFSEDESASIRPGAVVVPLGNGRELRRPWREGRVGGDGSLLKLFGAVAVPRLVDSGRGVSLCVLITLPSFQLMRWLPLRGFDAPAVAEVSLGIVLRGGDTVREGEHIGFLVRDVKSKANSVEPVLLSDHIGSRAIVGMWTLSERDVWAAAAVFAADSMTRRNTKVSRPIVDSPGRRDVQFLVAQFQEHAGGDPIFIPCMVTLPAVGERQHVSFVARLSAQPSDQQVLQNGIISATFADGARDDVEQQQSGPGPGHDATAIFEPQAPSRFSQDRQDISALATQSGLGNQSESVGMAQPRPGQLDSHPGSNERHANTRRSLIDHARKQQNDVNRRLESLTADLQASTSQPGDARFATGANSVTAAPSTGDDEGPGVARAWRAAETDTRRSLPGPSLVATEGQSSEPAGFAARLDTLARKYLGEQYRSDFAMD